MLGDIGGSHVDGDAQRARELTAVGSVEAEIRAAEGPQVARAARGELVVGVEKQDQDAVAAQHRLRLAGVEHELAA